MKNKRLRTREKLPMCYETQRKISRNINRTKPKRLPFVVKCLHIYPRETKTEMLHNNQVN